MFPESLLKQNNVMIEEFGEKHFSPVIVAAAAAAVLGQKSPSPMQHFGRSCVLH